MTIHKRASDRSTGGKLSSPGRPKAAHRDQHVMFWHLISKGLSAKKRRFRLARLPRLAVVGFGRLEACHHRNIQIRRHHCQGDICRSLSVRRSLCTGRRASECVSSLAKPGGRRRRYRGSCAVMLQHAAAGLNTRRNNLRQLVLPVAPKSKRHIARSVDQMVRTAICSHHHTEPEEWRVQ